VLCLSIQQLAAIDFDVADYNAFPDDGIDDTAVSNLVDHKSN